MTRTAGSASGQRRSRAAAAAPPDPLWYKNAVIYQVHVRSFSDSTGDGVGDFTGLISKLDYLADLGVTALWLLPFYPSPLRDDGYDISDYTRVNPGYGTLEEARRFIQEAHRRGMRVITELVVNHTSDQHAWFQRARRAPKGSPERDFYVWSDTPDKYAGVRIIFKDFETSNWAWDPVAQQYYWHRFYAHQPDLNFDNPAVHKAVFDACAFWLKMGVDGMRLDAVPYLYEREGTSCENLGETHEFLRRLRTYVDTNFPERMLLAEANQWPEDAIAYFGKGDECNMAFHFPLMPRLFMAVRMEDRYPIIDILEQTPAIPESCQWAVFLRNHDELTLEMVTDEERDYMYRVYAGDRVARINLGIRRRLAPLMSNSRRKIELMNALLFSMPGSPIIYYGDEIGMGDNVHLGDRNGVRTPMQWSADRNAGFSRANPQRLFLPVIIDPEYHYETVNVESQLANPSSILWWMKRLIALRKHYPVFGRGEMRFIQGDNPRVLAFIRRDAERTVLVIANLSRFVQPVALPLAEFQGRRPVEMFGSVPFPLIAESPYFLSLGPHGFYWFLLEPPASTAAAPAGSGELPSLAVAASPERAVASDGAMRGLERILESVLPTRRWFASKSKSLRHVRLVDRLALPVAGRPRGAAEILIARCEFATGEPEDYAIPLVVRPVPDDGPSPGAIARINGADSGVELADGMSDAEFARTLLRIALSDHRLGSGRLWLQGRRLGPAPAAGILKTIAPRTPKLEQSNSTAFFGEQYLLKLFRRLERGENPELELGRQLTRVGFPHTPPIIGAVELAEQDHEPQTLAVVLGFVPSQGDAWAWMLERVVSYLERAAAVPAEEAARLFAPAGGPLESGTPPARLVELMGDPLESVRLLGARTAEMHAALADDRGDPAFTPEPFTLMYQRSLLQSVRNSVRTSLAAVSRLSTSANEEVRRLASDLATAQARILAPLQPLTRSALRGGRIRTHGDYHLGQVLWTGRDFVIVDFEGEPLRSIGERRIKRSPLRDAAGMIRSLDYAAWAGLRRRCEMLPGERCDTQSALAHATAAWSLWASRAFLASYQSRISELNPGLLSPDPGHRQLLLRLWLVDKVMYEIRYELNARPDWVDVPLRAARAMLDEPSAPPSLAAAALSSP